VTVDLLIHNISELLTSAGPAPRRGLAQRDAGRRSRAALASSGGTIVYVGAESRWREQCRLAGDAHIIDAEGGAVVPGFVDPHTHLVFAGDRHDELERRLAGGSYRDIAAGGGGILATVQATRAASDAQLQSESRRRLDEMLRCGTTTCEAKSGYGLETATELRMLRTIRTLASEHAIEVCATFMAAHEVPPEWRDCRQRYLDSIIDEMLPAVADERLAEWCDVFCEVFTPDEARDVLVAARHAGLKLRVHADEFGPRGGSELAAELAVRSADHLTFIDDNGISALASAGVVATLLPAASFYLKAGRFAPGRALIDAGVPIALATDLNPGGGLSPSMPFAMALACFGIGLTFEEALVAATLNAAYSLDRHSRVGSLEVGKQMDAVVIAGPAVDLLRIGGDAIRMVVKNGRPVFERAA
jgi:imidazolonepropionase